ncbi:MAG: amidohydrolase family protein [Defluviitaleaceae bacterium]|nr:amidohydrolase family protein [Defluviitaleaceae bacterium]
MIIDACVFVGESLMHNSLSLEAYGAQMKRLGIDKAIVRPLFPIDYNFDRANQDLAASIKGDDRFIGFGRVNPWEKNAPEQVEKAAEYGLAGIHLHPWEETYPIHSEMVNKTIIAAKNMKFPVYVSVGYPNVSEPLQMLELALRFPEVTFIATHAAQLDISGGSIDDALFVALDAPNVLFDLSGVYRRDFIERMLNAGNGKNVIYGSCAPYMDPSLEIERVKGIQVPEEQKEAVFCGNISRVLGL